jgi:3',5'-cyclic AMP phosphodiesterase CpdA
MFRLAHISDVHLGPLPEVPLRDLMSKRITGYVNWHRNRRKHLFGNTLELLLQDLEAQSPDHIAVTGDLVNLATEIEIRNAATWLSGIGAPYDVSVVPGNHDAYVPGAAGRAATAWNDYLAGDGAILSESRKFPYVRRRGRVAIVGCSTAVATLPFSANGYFSAGQARRTLEILKSLRTEGLARVVLIHHPPIRGAAPNHKRMVGIRRFGAVMREAGAELVLHGHTHLNTLYQLAGRDGNVPVVGIASASQSHGGKKPPAAYNLFEIDGEPGEWQIRRQRYALNDDARTFRLDADEML